MPRTRAILTQERTQCSLGLMAALFTGGQPERQRCHVACYKKWMKLEGLPHFRYQEIRDQLTYSSLITAVLLIESHLLVYLRPFK
jgi:hypothetical protein